MEIQPPSAAVQPRSPDSAVGTQAHSESAKAPELVTLAQLYKRVSEMARVTKGRNIKQIIHSFSFKGIKEIPDQEGFNGVDVRIYDLPKMAPGGLIEWFSGAGGSYYPPELLERYLISNEGVTPKGKNLLPATNPEIVRALKDNDRLDSEEESAFVQRFSRALDWELVSPKPRLDRALGLDGVQNAIDNVRGRLKSFVDRKQP